MKRIFYFSILILLLGLNSVAYAQSRCNVQNIVTRDNNLNGWVDAFDIYISASIDDGSGGATDWDVLNTAGIKNDFIVGGDYALMIDSLNTGEFVGDNIFRVHISMQTFVGTGFTGNITLQYISNSARRIWDIYSTYLESFTPQPVFDGASPLLIEINTFDEEGGDGFVDKIKIRFTEPLNTSWHPLAPPYHPNSIFHFTDGIFEGVFLEHYGFETNILTNDTYVIHIPNADTLNNGNPTIGFIPMLPDWGFTNKIADNPYALRDPSSNLAVYGGGPYITEATTKQVGSDTYITVKFSRAIDGSSVVISDFEVVLDDVNQTIISVDISEVADSLVTLEVANIPPGLSGTNKLRLTSTLCIEDTEGNQNTVITWVNIRDGISPSVDNVVPSLLLITDSDVGTGTFTITVDFDEIMEGTGDPVSFPVENPTNTISFANGNWFGDTYIATYNVADVNETIPDIDIEISGIHDVTGNLLNLYTEQDAFDIDTENPEVVLLTPNPALISDADVGTNTFSLTIDYDEDMLTGGTADPVITFPVENPLNTITFNHGIWSDADTYVAYYDVIDVEETILDIDVHIEGTKDDPAGNTQVIYNETDVFDINTENPEVVSVTPAPALITDSDVGTNTFALTVDYSEDMITNGTADPVITFPVENPLSTITFNHGTWSDTDTYVAYYNVADVGIGETVPNIDVHIEGAKDDPEGNIQLLFDEADVFDIDTENPVVVSVTPSPVLITDSDAGRGIFTLTVIYNEDMLTGGTADPVITFPVENPLNTITFNNGSWSDAVTYIATYNVIDVNETVPNIDVHIESAIDDPAGNTQVVYNETDVFSIDTENPQVVSVINNLDLISDSDVGTLKFSIFIEYNEDMDMSVDPLIEFPNEDPSNSLILTIWGYWLDARNFIQKYNVLDANETIPDIDVRITSAKDDPAGNTQVIYNEADVFSIDTENPEVVSVSPSPVLITDSDVGVGTFCITINYDEAMLTGGTADPVITFPVENPLNTITFNNGNWYDTDTYIACYDVVDIDETIYNIDIHIEGAKDNPAGNTQVPYTEPDAFDIAMGPPVVCTVTPIPGLITDSDVGVGTFTIEVYYCQDMITNETADPVITFPVEDPTNTITYNVASSYWETDNRTWVAAYNVADVNETLPDIDIHVEGARDLISGNLQEPWDEIDAFDIDTENPGVVSVTPAPALITDSDVGTNTFVLTVNYSEDMLTNGTADPMITFPVENPLGTITFNHGTWSDTDTYVAYYNVADVGETVPNIDVHIEGAKDDPAGNTQVVYNEIDVFGIDTENPEVVSVTPAPILITDSITGRGIFTLTVVYNEDMLTGGTADPVITFPVENPLNTITFSNGSWSDAVTYIATYNVIDVNETVPDIDVHIESAIDDPAGNTQVPYNEADVFSIDTENPVVISVTPAPALITDSDVGMGTFTLTVVYHEDMLTNGTADPVITFPIEDPTNTITYNSQDSYWNNARTWIASYDVVDVNETVPDIDVHIEGTKDDPAGNTQVPYDEADVFDIDTENPLVISVIPAPVIITDADVGVGTFTLTVVYGEAMLTNGTTDPVITFPIENPLNTITFNNGSWSDAVTYVAAFDVADVNETIWDIDIHIEGAVDDPAGNIQVPYDETNVFDIDTENPISSALTAIYNSTTGCIEVEWEASDANGILQVELWVSKDGAAFVLADTDVTGNITGTFYYCLDPSPLVCEEGTYDFYTIATDNPGNEEAVPGIHDVTEIVDIIATRFVITTTPNSPEFGTYFNVNIAAADEAGIRDCEYSNIIHFLSNYPDDVTLPDEPLLSNGYQVYGNCIAFETMDDLIIEVYGIYPYENHSYSDPIVIQAPTIAPPTNTAAYDVPDDEGGWIYIDYELSLNDPFHSSTEMPNIHYYVVERDADTTAVENWQAVAYIYVYDPPVDDSASVMLEVPVGFVEYDYRMAAVFNQGYPVFGGNDGSGSQIEDQGKGPQIIYIDDFENRDQCWQSDWADCGSAAGSPQDLSAPVITNIYVESGYVYIEWGTVNRATSYTVYSDTDPYGSFTTVEEAGITSTSWNEPLEEKKFYRITANN